MLSLLQYISFYFNINIATFVVFQIAVSCIYVVTGAAYFYIHMQAQVARVYNAYSSAGVLLYLLFLTFSLPYLYYCM